MGVKDIKFSRREFLKFSSSLLASTFLFDLKDDSGFLIASTKQDKEEIKLTKEEKKIYTICGVCSMKCPVIGYVRNGRLVRVEGNPRSQLTEGHVCVKGRAGLYMLYDPDRLKYPMKRTNPKKGPGIDPGFVKISWDEAIDIVAKKFNEVIAKYGPQAIVIFARPKTALKHFAKSIGTPNICDHYSICDHTHDVAWSVMVLGKGKTKPFTKDYSNSKYILSFGWDAGKGKNKYIRDLIAALDKGAKYVVFDPVFSMGASKAHEWIPIKPGTDLAVLLAMIRTIINENLYDHEFVSKYTIGFDELKERVQPYTPEWAEKISEVPASTIVRIAREFATTKPAVVAFHKRDVGGPIYRNSFRTAQCIVIMNALVGSIDRPGGVILTRKPKIPQFEEFFQFKYPEPPTKERIDGLEKYPLAHLGNLMTVAHGILSEKPYPVKAGFVWKYNLFSFPDPPTMIEALKKLDFLVQCDIYMNEMSYFADIILPENCYWEGKGWGETTYFCKEAELVVKEGLKPLYDTKGIMKIVLSILKKMGLKEFAPDEEALKAYDKAVFEALGVTREELLKNHEGVWRDSKPFEPKTEFGTPSKKIEFAPTLLKEYGYDPLPYWIEPKVMPNEEYPYRLIIYHNLFHRMVKTHNIPLLMELRPENTVLINTKEAEKLGIKDGDYVWVEASNGRKIKVKAELTEGIRPDCVAIDHGYGHWSKGMRVAYGKGSNEGDLVVSMSVDEMLKINPDDPAANCMWNEVIVRIRKA